VYNVNATELNWEFSSVAFYDLSSQSYLTSIRPTVVVLTSDGSDLEV